MDEKEPKSLTIGDILDQLVKSSVIQNPVNLPPRPVSPPASALPSIQTGVGSEVKLPQLGKGLGGPTALVQNYPSKSAELRLSIRTMAEDIERLKRGQKVVNSEVQRATTPTIAPSPVKPPSSIAPLPLRPIPPRPVAPPPLPPLTMPPRPVTPQPRPTLPPLRLIPLPPISVPLPPTGEPKHYHPERVVGKEEILPPFLGAPIPKKARKPIKERVEYMLIAKIIGSGMTTGIIITLILAGVGYGLIYFFFLKKAGSPIVIPTPVPTEITTTPNINELKTIFITTAVLNFQLPENKQEALLNLKSFINNQTLLKKEVKRLNLTVQSDQEQGMPSFADLLTDLSLNYPPELKNEMNNNNVVLLYGQEELFYEQAGPTPKKVVFIAEIKDVLKISEIMEKWEQTIANDFKDMLDIDPARQASQTFLSNERRGVKIRYKNFPLPDKSIDYAIVSSLTNHHYLIITNSRESMYSPTDKIRGL